VFSGNGHLELAKAICRHLKIDLGACEVTEFSNENVFVKILENVRQRDTFIVQPLVSPVNTRLMELLVMIDAFKRSSAGRITRCAQAPGPEPSASAEIGKCRGRCNSVFISCRLWPQAPSLRVPRVTSRVYCGGSLLSEFADLIDEPGAFS
jgi:hypothetical protein